MSGTDEFRASIERFVVTWKSIEIRAIADMDKGTILTLVACLSPEEPKPSETVDSVFGIDFIKENVSISELDRILGIWHRRQIHLGERDLSVPDSQFPEPVFQGVRVGWPRLVEGWPEFQAFGHFVLISTGAGDVGSLLRPKDLVTIANGLAYDHFAELSRERVRFAIDHGSCSTIELFAPLLSSIEARSQFADWALVIKVHYGLSKDGFTLSYRVHDKLGAAVEKRALQLVGLQANRAGYFDNLTLPLSISPGSVGGWAQLRHKWYRDGLEPVASARFVFPETETSLVSPWNLMLSVANNTRNFRTKDIAPENSVKDWLGLDTTRPTPRDEQFEKAVSCLLFFAGLPALHFGEMEGVDLQVFGRQPRRCALLVSCVTSADISRKIGPLMTQLMSAKAKLPSMEIFAVIAAPVDKLSISSAHLQDCQAKGIRLLLRPDLQVLFDKVRGMEWEETGEGLIQSILDARQF